MLEPIYNRRGKVDAWFDGEAGDIYDRKAVPIGFVEGDAYFTRKGKYLGEFDAGVFWDSRGRAIAFLEGATGGPLLPLTSIPPIPPSPTVPPARPSTPLAPLAPMQTLSWSDVDFTDIFHG